MEKVRTTLQEQAIKGYFEELRLAESKALTRPPAAAVARSARRAPTMARTLTRVNQNNTALTSRENLNQRKTSTAVAVSASTPAPNANADTSGAQPDKESNVGDQRSYIAEPEAEENSDDYDTDLEDGGVTRRDPAKANLKAEAIWVAQYKAECSRLNVVPIGQAVAQIGKKRWVMKKCAIGPREMHALSKLIVSKFDLVAIDLTSSAIGPEGLRYLIAAVLENRSIEELNLAENELGSEGCSLLCSHLDVIDRIRMLNLGSNHFKPSDGQGLAEMIRRVVSLREIDFSKNELGEHGAEAIAEALCDNTALQSLDLSWNHIRLGGARALGHSLNENQTLKKLNVGWNGFADEAIKPLTRALETNQGLIELDLSSNRLGLDGAIAISKALERNETLQSLRLNQNLLTTRGAEYILAALKKNTNSHVELVEMDNVPVTFTFGAVYNELLSTRRVIILHDKYVRFPDKITAEGPNPKDVLKIPPADIVRYYLAKRRINIAREEIVVNRSSVEKKVEGEENLIDIDDESDRIFVAETIGVTINVNPDTGLSTMDAQHFKILLKKVCAPIQDAQIDAIAKKAGKDGQLDVTPYIVQNLPIDFEAALNNATPEKTALYPPRSQ